MPHLLQPFLQPKTFYPQGPPWRVPLEGPPSTARLPLTHAGLQVAPCGCCFHPHVSHIPWTTTSLSPPATTTLGHGAPSLLGAAPSTLQGRTVAPAPPVLPPCFPGTRIWRGTMRHPAADLPLSEEMPVDRSLVTQLGPSCVPMPGYPGGTGGAISCNIGSLSLPAELLSPDHSIPETSNALLSLQQFNTIGMGPQEPWWDVGTGLASPQPGRLGKRGEK
ncbi:uncharacterized protein LOC128906367 [Rissa tridactyla]|uniref:uncharacterized protein LOC128906367 n=1 Tax=Rissa tridactyla TaxID=75485 RepID=UPI0023BB0337|nr:uncharacterized protein LOC128906367 [Rissa tridactyla]